jgi:hypothetical protein
VLQEVDNMSASEARRRLEAFRKKQQAAKQQQQQQQAGGAAPGPSSETEAVAAAAAAASVSFEGAISEAFEDSLKYYVAEEQKEVRWQLPLQCMSNARLSTLPLIHCMTAQRFQAHADSSCTGRS